MLFQVMREKLPALYFDKTGKMPAPDMVWFMEALGRLEREAYEEGYRAGLAARSEEESE